MAMIESCRNPQHKALIALCGLCGLRVQEAVNVVVKDIDPARLLLTVRGKGDAERIVPISSEAWPALLPALVAAVPNAPGLAAFLVPITESAARRLITRRGTSAGISRKVSSHDLRATFATATYEKSGGDIRAVQELLGHSQVETTAIYIGVSLERMRKAVA